MKEIKYATLDGKEVRPCSLMEYARWTASNHRTVAKDYVGKIRISTVFLGLNHGWNGEDLWFETMVFGGTMDEECWRYETYDEAVSGHVKIVEAVRKCEQK